MKRILHAGSTLAVGSQHRVLVLVHGRARPEKGDWAAFCEILVAEHTSARGLLVVTEGGVPDAAQRQAALAALSVGFVAPPVAVISDQPLVRSVVTVLNWFLKDNHRSFRASDVRGVATHLHLIDDEACDLLALAGELVAQLSVPRP